MLFPIMRYRCPPRRRHAVTPGAEAVATNTALSNQCPLLHRYLSDSVPTPAVLYHVISGHFYGVLQEQRFVNEPDYAGNDCRIGEIKDVPFERPGRCGNMNQYKIHYGAVHKAIDPISDRPTDNQSERQTCQMRARLRQPDEEEHDRSHLEGEQHPLPERSGLLEQPIADAGVPGEHQVEKRRDGHPTALVQAE